MKATKLGYINESKMFYILNVYNVRHQVMSFNIMSINKCNMSHYKKLLLNVINKIYL